MLKFSMFMLLSCVGVMVSANGPLSQSASSVLNTLEDVSDNSSLEELGIDGSLADKPSSAELLASVDKSSHVDDNGVTVVDVTLSDGENISNAHAHEDLHYTDKEHFAVLAQQMKNSSSELVYDLNGNADYILAEFQRIAKILEQRLKRKSGSILVAIHSSADQLQHDNEALADAVAQLKADEQGEKQKYLDQNGGDVTEEEEKEEDFTVDRSVLAKKRSNGPVIVRKSVHEDEQETQKSQHLTTSHARHLDTQQDFNTEVLATSLAKQKKNSKEIEDNSFNVAQKSHLQKKKYT